MENTLKVMQRDARVVGAVGAPCDANGSPRA
jgi:hypothetical protein